MRPRLAARLLLTDSLGRILLFHFAHRTGALAGSRYWATPGGGVECDETCEQAAIRELWEETGIRVDEVGPQIARRQAVFQMTDGEYVVDDERYFHIRVANTELSNQGWTAYERECMTEMRWWLPQELCGTSERVWPADLLSMLHMLDLGK